MRSRPRDGGRDRDEGRGRGRGREAKEQHHVVYGVHAVTAALEKGRRTCHKLFLEQGRKDAEAVKLSQLARSRNVPVTLVRHDDLGKFAGGGRHQGFVLFTDPPVLWELVDALQDDPPGKQTLWIGLDEVTDPHNVGAILRSASCLGATAALLPDRRTAPITPVVEKVASGALETVRVIDVGNLNSTILDLKERGFWVYGAALEGKPLPEVEFQGPALVVIGSEGYGLREKTRGHCDELVKIPQAAGGVESLNASCAASILMYEIARQLKKNGQP